MTDDLDLSAVAADAALLDALAEGSVTDVDDLGGLGALRAALDEDLADLLLTPAPALTAVGSAPVVLGRHRVPSRSRRSRQAAALLAGAALALSSTGVAAATYEARPGDAFYGLRTAVAGPRAEDPALLRERLDAVQERLEDAPTAGTPADAAAELAEVAALLSTLDPSLRGDLAQRLDALTEQLAASPTGRPDAAGKSAPDPAGPPQGVPTGPPADAPATGRPEQPGSPRTEPTRGSGSTPPARPASPPSADPEPQRASPEPRRATPEPGRPSSGDAEPDSEEPAQPAPRGTQGARPSPEPATEPVQEPAQPADEARTPRAGSALDAVPAPTSR